MIEEKGRMIFTTSKVDDKSTNNNYTSKCNTTKPLKFIKNMEEEFEKTMMKATRMNMKVKRIAIFDSEYNLNGFNVHPGNILGSITNNDGKELSFFIKLPFYINGCQQVFAKPEDIIEYGVENFKVRDSEKDLFINRLKSCEGFAPVNLIVNINEWCSLLSKRQLEFVMHNYHALLSEISISNGYKIRKILSYLNAIDNELRTRNKLDEYKWEE